MEVIICKNSTEASHLGARLLKNQVKNKVQSVLGLATGSTPIPLYQKFVNLIHAEKVNVQQITTFNLDEYVGVPSSHPGSYAHYIRKHLLEPLHLKEDQMNIPNGMTSDVGKECEDYEKKIQKSGPIDLQILGLGQDGHIGFNEPGSSLGSRTRLKSLTEETRKVNGPTFSDLEEVPRHVMTMGIQTIMESQKIALLAFGAKKAEAVKAMVEGPVTAMIPASVLQFHPHVKVFLDEESASKLQNIQYYREVFAHKPPWQMADFV